MTIYVLTAVEWNQFNVLGVYESMHEALEASQKIEAEFKRHDYTLTIQPFEMNAAALSYEQTMHEAVEI